MRAGDVLAYWDGSEMAFAVHGGEEKQRIRLVLRNAREDRIRANRVITVVDSGGAAPGKSVDERREAGRRAEAAGLRVERLSAEVDVPLLWEIDERPAGEATSIEQFAEVSFTRNDGETRCAVMRAMTLDGIHFVRKGDAWSARSAGQVEALKLERARLEEREREASALLDVLRMAWRERSFRPTGSELERRTLAALEEVAIHGDDASEAARSLATETLEAVGVRHARLFDGAFRLMRRVGRFDSDDANLQVERFGLRTTFPDDVSAAAAAASPAESAGRRDLTELRSLSIDSPSTREIDDLVSIEPLTAGWRVGVHIADPSAFFTPGDPIDEEARRRAITHYMPDLRLTMLPPAIGEVAASLVERESRPALSFLVEIDRDGEVLGGEIVRSVVRSHGRCNYAEVDAALAQDAPPEPWSELDAAARALEAARRRAGALPLQVPEVDVKVVDGEPVLERLEGASASRRIVTEAMVLAGERAARWFIEREVPAVFRTQAAPAELPPIPERGVTDPVLARTVRMSLKRAESSLAPGPHASLGVAAYVQITSPLRRYLDLTLQRQLIAVLAGAEPMSEDAIADVASLCSRAESDARKAERAANDYWMLRHLERFVGQTLPARVLQGGGRPVVQLTDCLWEQVVPSLSGAETGETVELRVERVRPRAGILVLRPA